jgi:hypothetical protein
VDAVSRRSTQKFKIKDLTGLGGLTGLEGRFSNFSCIFGSLVYTSSAGSIIKFLTLYLALYLFLALLLILGVFSTYQFISSDLVLVSLSKQLKRSCTKSPSQIHQPPPLQRFSILG